MFIAEVIKVIRDSAFSMNTKGETNDMPVIISLKHKCSWDQQKMLAEILKTELGDMLLRAPLSREPLQAPIYLRGKILLQGRKQEGKTHNELYKLFYFTTTHSPDFEDCDFDCSVVNSCDDAEAEKRMRDSKQRAAWASHNLTNLRYLHIQTLTTLSLFTLN